MTDPALLPVLQKLVPQKDGEPYTVHRSAVVAAVNAGGTVDLTMSGVTVPDVPVLGGATAPVGAVVSVLAWQGALLVLGEVATSVHDTGWVTVTPTAPFAHGSVPGQVRRVGKQVFFQGGIGGSITQNTTTIIGNVPAGFRPPDGARSITSGAATQGTAVYYMNVESNGDIRVRVTPTGTYNIALGALGYLLD
jgi:hypothetical protein